MPVVYSEEKILEFRETRDTIKAHSSSATHSILGRGCDRMTSAFSSAERLRGIGSSSVVVAVAILCLAGSILSGWVFLSLPGEPASDFRILPSAVQELGKIKQRSLTKVEFSLENVTSRMIAIVEVVTTCGCTTTEISKRQLLPGDETKIILLYDSRQSRGKVNAIAHVMYRNSDGGDLSSLRLVGTGEIDPDYFIVPETLQFISSKRSVQRISVAPRYATDFCVTHVASNSRFFQVRLIDSAADNAQIEVAFDPAEYYEDAGLAQLSIYTNSAVQPIALIPLEVTQLGRD